MFIRPATLDKQFHAPQYRWPKPEFLGAIRNPTTRLKEKRRNRSDDRHRDAAQTNRAANHRGNGLEIIVSFANRTEGEFFLNEYFATHRT